MDLQKFEFPKVDGIDIAFPTFNTIPALKEEAIKRGFDNYNNKWCKRFSDLFYGGGKLNLKADHNKDMLNYMRSFIGSFAPKHEDKEMICAMLLSELEVLS